MKQCTVDVKVILRFVKDKVAEDPKYKDFDVLADYLLTRNQPDDIKVAVVKAVAQIYKSLADRDSSFKISSKINFLIDTKIQDADLKELYKTLKEKYEIKTKGSPTSIDDLVKQIDSEKVKDDYELTLFIKKMIDSLNSLITRLSPAKAFVVKNHANLAISKLINKVESVANLGKRTKDRALEYINKTKEKIDLISEYVPLGSTRFGQIFRVLDDKGRILDQVFLNQVDGKYYSVSTSTIVNVDGKKLQPIFYDRPGAVGREITQSGEFRILNSAEVISGMRLFFGGEKAEMLKNILLNLSDPNSKMEIRISKQTQKYNKQRLQKIKEEVPNRTIETFESYEQQRFMRTTGKPVATVSSPTSSATILISVPGFEEAGVIYDMSNYSVVYPNNTTQLLDFTDKSQWDLIKSLFVKPDSNRNLVPLTDADLQRISDTQNKINDFKIAALKYLEEKGGDEVVIPEEMYKGLIGLEKGGTRRGSLASEEQGELLSDVIKNKEAQKYMITANVIQVDEEGEPVTGNVEERKIPMLIRKSAGTWSFVGGVINSNERIVDENGEYLTSDQYFKKIHPNALNVKSYVPNFPGHIGYAIVQFDKTSGRYIFIGMNRDFGADPVKNLLRFVNALGSLTKKIKADPGNQNRITREFNQKQYTFAPYDGWYADLTSFYDKDKQEVNYNIELRPINDKDYKQSGDEESAKRLKKASNLRINSVSLNELTTLLNSIITSKSFSIYLQEKSNGQLKSYQDLVNDDGTQDPMLFNMMFDYVANKDLESAINKAYDKVASEIRKSLSNVVENLEKIGYPLAPKPQLILENEKSDFTGRDYIKIQDKQTELSPTNFDQFRLVGDIKPTMLFVKAPGLEPIVYSSAVNPQSSAESTSKTEARDLRTKDVKVDDDVIDESDFGDAPFSLTDISAPFVEYNNQSYKDEEDWIKRNLPSDIKIEDLAGIISSLKADGRILGYMKDRVIYMNQQLSSEGTGYHEAFHAVFRHLLDETDRRYYTARALAEVGKITQDQVNEFRTRRSLFHLSDSSVKDRIAEEYLADKFKAYALDNKEPRNAWLRYFVRLFKKIMNFFTKNSNQIDDITTLFNRINTGYYKNASVVSEFTEGAFDLLPSRPVITGTNAEGKLTSVKDYFNNYDQLQLVNRLAWETSMSMGETFNDKYEDAVKKLLNEYNIENLIANNPQADPEKIRNKYQDLYANIRFALGDVESLYQNTTGNSELDRKINENTVKESYEILKSQVKKSVKDIDIKGLIFNTDAELEEDLDDEDKQIKEGYEDSFGNLNPLDGLSRQFRKFFSVLPYVYEDKDTGVTVTKMIDGTKVFYTFMKVSADVPSELILKNLDDTIESLREDQSESYEKLSSVFNTLKVIFGLDDDYQPTKNLNFYNQFLNTFNVTEIPSLIYRIRTYDTGNSSYEIYDATIQKDIYQEIEKLKISYNKKYFNKSDKQKKEIFEEVKSVIDQELPKTGDLQTGDRKILRAKATALKNALDKMGLNFSLNFIEFSLVNIDLSRNEDKVFTSKSRAGQLLSANPILSSQGSYLQEDFFRWVASPTLGHTTNIFEKTDFDLVDPEDLEEMDRIAIRRTGEQNKQIDGLNAILKKAAKYLVKHNVDANISVFQNAENKNVYRYVKYTPLLQLAQVVKTKGLQGLVDEYPMYEEWFEDNPYYNPENKDKEIQLYLNNFYIAMFGGTRQTIMNDEKEGSTFKHTDPRSKFIADVAMFSSREVTRRNKTEIITYNRSFSILEGSSTNFMIPVLYKQMYTSDGFVEDKKGTPLIVNAMLDQIKQEYNRIQREWSQRNEVKNRYLDYDGIKLEDGTIDTTSPALRAYNFNRLSRFFGANESKLTTFIHPENGSARAALRDRLIEAAKSNIPFKEVMSSKPGRSSINPQELKNQLLAYVNEEFQSFLDSLQNYGVINFEESGEVSSEFLPTKVKTGLSKENLTDKNYSTYNDFLADYFLNDFSSKLFVNQFFDGDLAMNVKNSTNYAMRNKAGIISGDSMRDGFHTVAYVDKVKVWIDTTNVDAGQYDNKEDIPEDLLNNPTANWEQIDVMDGMSITTLEHRIDMYEKQGRLEELYNDGEDERNLDVKSILQKARVEPLTKEEVEYLENAKIVLGSYKTATGGINEFHKLSEHIILRTDVSYISSEYTYDEAVKRIKKLLTEVDFVRDYLKKGEEYVLLQGYNKSPREALKDLYTKIHSFYKPLPGREIWHNILNSMDYYGIDQMMDVNSSKKSTLIPTKLNLAGVTDFSVSSKPVLNKYKYMQVETSGVSRTVTVPTQKRQLIDSSIDLSSKTVPVELKDAVRNYRKTLAESSNLSLDEITKILDAPNNQVNITPILRTMRKGLESQGADANTLKLFEIDEVTGKPKYNINLPMFKTLFQNYFFAFYSNNLFSEKSSGRKDFEVTSLGYKVIVDENDNIVPQSEVKKNPSKYAGYKQRYPGVKTEIDEKGNVRYVVEVIIAKPFFRNEQHEQLFLNRLAEWIATRIPTEDFRSMLVARAVDYVDSAYQNIIIVPQFINILSGGDLDIDAIYSQTLATYEGIDGKEHVFGEYDTYENVSKNSAKFLEYVFAKMDDPNLGSEIEDEYNKIIDSDGAMDEIPLALQSLIEYLNLEDFGLSKSNLKARLSELKEIRKSYYANYKSIKDERQRVFTDYVNLRTKNEELYDAYRKLVIEAIAEQGVELDMNDPKVIEEVNIIVKDRIISERLAGYPENLPDFKLQGEYSARLRVYQEAAKSLYQQMTGAAGDIKDARDVMKRLNKLFKMISTLNVLAKYKFPTSIETIANSKTPLVKEVIQNENIKAQMDILSNPYVFNNLYKNEKSDTKYFKKLIESQEKPIDNVVDKFDMNNPAWIVNLLNMNSASDDNIGVSATANKFAAFASKYGLKLMNPVWQINGKVYDQFKTYSQDQNKDVFRVIAEIGKSIGMSADAKKEPYPSILNLDQQTMGISLAMIAQGVDPTFSFNINLVPIISDLIKKKQTSTSNTVTLDESWRPESFKSIALGLLLDKEKQILKDKTREGEIYQKGKNGKIMIDSQGNKVLRKIDFNFNYDFTPKSRTSLEDYGFSAVYKGTDEVVAEDVLEFFILDSYIQQIDFQTDVLAVNNILGLIKKQKPSFEDFDRLVYNYAYLMGYMYKKPNFSNISQILDKQAIEYKPLLNGVEHLFKTSQKVFLERNPIFSVINEELGDSFSTFRMSSKYKSAVSTHVVRFMIINRTKARFENQLREELAKKKPNVELVKRYQDAAIMFTSDFWEGKVSETTTSLAQDIDYLYETNANNPFVQFIKYRTNNGITFVEALSRMKLDTEITDSIIDGYNLLSKSLDPRTRMIADKLFMYILVKDNLSYSNNSFLKYINPEKLIKISEDLTTLQDSLNKALDSKKERSNILSGKVFKDFLMTDKASLSNVALSVLQKAFTNVNNREYTVKTRKFQLGNKRTKLGKIQNKENLIQFLNEIVPNLSKYDWRDVYGIEKVANLEEQQKTGIFINDGYFDLFVPTSKDIDQGTVTLNLEKLLPKNGGEIQDVVLSVLKVNAEYDVKPDGTETFVGWKFPMSVINSEGQLFLLETLDNVPIGERVAQKIKEKLDRGSSFKNPSKISLAGTKAVYRVSSFEGTPGTTEGISNNGFTTTDARSLYDFYEKAPRYSYIESSQEFDKFLIKMVEDYGVSQQQVELLKKWVKTDVYSKGMIKFGKEGKFSLKYSTVNDQGFTDSYVIELTPAEKMSDANSIKATQYKLIDGLKIELYTKEFKAIDIIKLTKAQKKELRLQQLKEKSDQSLAKFLGTSVEELEQKGLVETRDGISGKSNEKSNELLEQAINKVKSFKTEEEFKNFFLFEFMNTSGVYTKLLTEEDYGKLEKAIQRRQEQGFETIKNEPSQKPKFEVVGNAVVYTEDGSIAEEYNTPEEAKEGLKSWLNVEGKPIEVETKKPVRVFAWARKNSEGFELSTIATNPLGKKFSALNAKLKDGRSIEEAYQLDIKGYRKVLNEMLDKGERYYKAPNGKTYDLLDRGAAWMLGKGKPPINKMTQEESYKAYVNLWRQFAVENPDLIKQLFVEAKSRILTDTFGTTEINQARAISDVMNEIIDNPSIIGLEKDDFTC